MVDERSLCDRRAIPNTTLGDFADDAQFQQHLDEDEGAPACGACILLAGRIRRQASAIIADTKKIHPKDPREGWESLHDTRWARHLDLNTFLQRDDLDQIRYDAIDLAVDPGSVKQLINEDRDYIKTVRDAWNQYRSEQIEEENDDDPRP